MTRAALADRIINYCDALVAFSLVNALAFLVTLAEPEIRCSIAAIAPAVGIMNLAFPCIISIVLSALARFQRTLRANEEEDERVQQFWGYAQITRHVLVWVFGLLVVVGVWAGTLDKACAGITPPG